MSWSSNATETGTKYFVEPGNYWLSVLTADEKYSSNGNPMIEIEFDVIGQNCKVKTQIMDPNVMPKCKWQSDTFALSAGLAPKLGDPYVIDANKLPGVVVYAQLV